MKITFKRRNAYFPIIIGLIIIAGSCTSESDKNKTKLYAYSSFAKYYSINNIYDKYGYPNSNSLNWNKPVNDKSIILVDQKKKSVSIYSLIHNTIETYKIIDSDNTKILSGNSFSIYTRNENGDQCDMMLYDDLQNNLLLVIMSPYQPAILYTLVDFDPDELMEKLDRRFNRIPRN